MSDAGNAEWRAAAALGDARRRAMYQLIRDADRPLTRDDVAQALNMPRSGVGFHLDTLVEAGLLSVDFARPAGRTGPGAGRPSKRYAVTDLVVDAVLPARRYAELGELLSTAVLRSTSDETEQLVLSAAHARGADVGRDATDGRRRVTTSHVLDVLRSLGYRPEGATDRPVVRLRDCPFHDVSRAAPELVCPTNLRYVQGILDGIGASDSLHAVLDDAGSGCCVSLHTAAQ